MSQPDPFDTGIQARTKLYAYLDHSELGSAEALCQSLLETQAGDPELLYLSGVVAHKSGRPDAAIQRFHQAISRAPTLESRAAALIGLGKSYWMLEQLEQARDAFEAARKLQPEQVSLWVSLGAVHTSLGNPLAAQACFERARILDPNEPDALTGLGLCLMEFGRYAEARESLDQVLQRFPAHAEAEQALGTLDRITGRFEDAEKRLFALLTQHPDRMGYGDLASIRIFETLDDPRLRLLEGRFQSLPQAETPEVVRIDLLFALARAYDDLGRSEEAFRLLEEASRLKRRHFRFDVASEETRMQRIAGIFTHEFIERGRLDHDSASPRPIFIVGLPRSGSTLLEHILSAHPDITATGELTILPRLAIGLGASWGQLPGFPDTLPEDRMRLDLQNLRLQYFREIETLTGYRPAGIFTDKLLGNFLFIGIIRMAFPDARIVHMQRHPLDQALSAYRQLFTQGHAYTYDLDEFGRYYKAYRGLMTDWHKVAHEAIYDLTYESLVRNPESEIRKLLGFLGLPFVPECLATQAIDRPVHTASAIQVRERINQEAIGRWQRYRTQLEPLREMLEQWIPAEPN